MISIIIPLYNSENYIVKLIDNLYENTSSDDEVIFVNDGSTDKTGFKLLQNVKKLVCSYRILDQYNGGQSLARNHGFRYASKLLVCFMDADDYLNRNFSLVKERLSKFNYVDFFIFGFKVVNNNVDNNKLNSYLSGNHFKLITSTNKTMFINKFISKSIKIHNSAIIFRKEFLLKNNILFNDQLRFGEDSVFIWESIIKSKSFAYSNLNVYYYVVRPGSVIKTSNLGRIELFLSELNSMILANRSSISDLTLKRISSNYSISCARIVSKHYTKNSFKDYLSKSEILKLKCHQVHGIRFLLTLLFLKIFKSNSYYILGKL